VNAGVWKTPDYVVEQLGKEAGEKFNKALYDSPGQVFDLIERYKIDCQAKRCGTINIAHKASSLDYLRDRHAQMQKLGASVRLLNGEEASVLSGSAYYRYGGILDQNAGTLQPLSYARGLAKSARELGVRIFEESPLISLQRQCDDWLARTDCGEVTAGKVVLATNAYADKNTQQVRNSTLPVFIFQCATKPLSSRVAETVIPERHGIWDTQTLLTSSRIDESGRLVMSSAGSLHGMAKTIRQDWMRRLRDRLYPQTRGEPWACHWTGQVGVTSTKILRVQQLAPGLLAPAGFNGRGIGPGTVIGKYLAEILVNGEHDNFPFPIETIYREEWRKLRSAYYEYGTLGLQAIKDRF
ncbi:MAG: FAD-binding oxidoreductase, partial [Gammaproteobacteria bacterium]|nr:FAD-binding oxidoreductase [Gammaproteobacteria bacterium]